MLDIFDDSTFSEWDCFGILIIRRWIYCVYPLARSPSCLIVFFFSFLYKRPFKYLRLINNDGSHRLRARASSERTTLRKYSCRIKLRARFLPSLWILARFSPSGPAAAVSSKYIKYIIQFIRLKSPLFPFPWRATDGRSAKSCAPRRAPNSSSLSLSSSLLISLLFFSFFSLS